MNRLKILSIMSVIMITAGSLYFVTSENNGLSVSGNADWTCTRITYDDSICTNLSCGDWSTDGTRTCNGTSSSTTSTSRCTNSSSPTYTSGSSSCSIVQTDTTPPIGEISAD